MRIPVTALFMSQQARTLDHQPFTSSQTTMVILEPFLVMMMNEEVQLTLPLTAVVDALLAFIGIDLKKHPRPSNSGLRTIVLDIRRDVEKRPPQRPRM
jgi:hypothetical protein